MTDENNNEAQIRAIISERVAGIDRKDAGALMINHARNQVTFDVLDPLYYQGVEKIKARAEQWVAAYSTKIGYEIRDLHITSGETVAFCHYLYHVSGTLKTGADVSMWVRATICFGKADGAWQIIHEHQSVPFNVETGKASVNLTPSTE